MCICTRISKPASDFWRRKHIPIQGTNINLDTPEALEAWVAERKKRWPSAQRVEEKKRKIQEAVARGQIDVDDPSFTGRKRRRTDDTESQRGRAYSGRARGRGRGAVHIRSSESDWRARGGSGPDFGCAQFRPPAITAQQTEPPSSAARASLMGPDHGSNTGDDSSDNEPPEVITSKLPLIPTSHSLPQRSPSVITNDQPPPDEYAGDFKTMRLEKSITAVKKHRPPQPKQPPHNPFGNRRSLLRNVSRCLSILQKPDDPFLIGSYSFRRYE
jgi:hypothetical protein